MTIEAHTRRIPRFGLGHRLALAREVAGLEQIDIAGVLDTSRATVSNYERGVSKPNRLQVNAWAVACDVDVEWLKTGKAPEEGTYRRGEGQPSDYKATVSDIRQKRITRPGNPTASTRPRGRAA